MPRLAGLKEIPTLVYENISDDDAKSFSKAADELFISPTAIIKQINILESHLGIQLFTRTHRGVSLTEGGASLYTDAKHLIQYANESIGRAKNAMLGNENEIRIGTSPMTPGQFLISLWPQLQERYPDVKFKLVTFENTPEIAREKLKNLGQHIDVVAGLYDQDFLKVRGCAALKLSMEPIRCGVSINHRLALKDTLTVQDLYGENLMLIHRTWNSYVDTLRDDLIQHHTPINIIDFDFYNTDVFNKCENNNHILMTIGRLEECTSFIKNPSCGMVSHYTIRIASFPGTFRSSPQIFRCGS